MAELASSQTAEPLPTLGLGGDGDEIWAIQSVENEFCIKLDYADAPGWLTVGDVFASLKRAITDPAALDASDLWERFAEAISRETAVDPARVTPETTLISPTAWRTSILIIAMLIGAGVAIFQATR